MQRRQGECSARKKYVRWCLQLQLQAHNQIQTDIGKATSYVTYLVPYNTQHLGLFEASNSKSKEAKLVTETVIHQQISFFTNQLINEVESRRRTKTRHCMVEQVGNPKRSGIIIIRRRRNGKSRRRCTWISL